MTPLPPPRPLPTAPPPDAGGPDGDPPLVRLRDADDVLDAVPHLLGYRPAASLVLVGSRGRPGRVGLTQRLDLPPPAGDAAAARLLARNAARDGATEAVAVLYLPEAPAAPTGSRRPVLPRRRLATEVLGACGDAGVHLVDAVAVAAGRRWSYLCPEPRCCPPEGVPLRDGASAVTASLVATGSAPLPSRAALVATLDPVPDPEVAEACAATGPALAGADPAAVLAETLAVARAAAAWWAEGRPPPAAVVARLLVGVQDRTARDALALRPVPPGGRGPVVAMWCDLVRRCPPHLVAEPAALLGWLAYRDGNGALARTALARALAADDRHVLASLLEGLLDAAVPPRAVEAALRAAR